MTSRLITTPNIELPDEVYARLLEAHEGLSKEESDALNARLILILCNHIGDLAVVEEALALAARTGRRARQDGAA